MSFCDVKHRLSVLLRALYASLPVTSLDARKLASLMYMLPAAMGAGSHVVTGSVVVLGAAVVSAEEAVWIINMHVYVTSKLSSHEQQVTQTYMHVALMQAASICVLELQLHVHAGIPCFLQM